MKNILTYFLHDIVLIFINMHTYYVNCAFNFKEKMQINNIIKPYIHRETLIMKNFTLFFVLFLSLFITACGGGGNSGAANNQVVAQAQAQATWDASNTKFTCPALKTGNIGINQSTPNYYGSLVVFADLLKHSPGWRRPFNSPYTSTPLQLDQDGYPTVIDLDNSFVAIIHNDDWGRDTVNDNTYVLLYDGEGTFDFNLNHTVLEQSPGRIVYQINAQGRMILELTSTNPNNHARNMRFVALSDELTHATQPFRKGFLETWAGFPINRYMDWLSTNNSPVAEWSDRTTPTDMVQNFGTGEGGLGEVAYEYIIQLSNYTKTNPWINIPHLASDDYVTQLATLFKNTLDPDLTVYIEYTNEAWNSMFSQTGYMNTKAGELGLPSGREYFAQRTSEIMGIWSNVYSGIPQQRYVRVLGAFIDNTYMTNTMLSWGNTFEYVDAVAVAPYFGGTMGRVNNVDATLAMSPSQLAQYLIDIELPLIKDRMISQKDIANTYGLRLIAYEGGQHLVGVGTHATYGPLDNYQPLTNLFIATNRDPIMKDAYIEYLSNWKEVSGDLMVLFDAVRKPGRFGSWGLLEYGTQSMDQAPKAMAVYEFVCGIPQ